jgi:RNA polymerase sigma factor (sigma-70 family)
VLVEEDRMVALLDAAQHEHPATHIEQKSKKILLEKALKQLPESEGRVLHLFYQASQSVEEIATITGTTIANVKVRLFRARQHLKEIIETRYKKELID